ncbi:MAG: hypothetical protein ACT4NX_08810 [Deltaproteobacteria bacterium]
MDSIARDLSNSDDVPLKWSEVLESAFEYYYGEFLPAWTIKDMPLCAVGEKILISKTTKKWVGWERIEPSKRPCVATLFDLLPDLPPDEKYREIMRELKSRGVRDAENYFWENIFSYKKAREIESNGRKFKIAWEA